MSKARSPRAVCSTTIGTRAMFGLCTFRLVSVTSLLYVALPFAGSFFFAIPGKPLDWTPFVKGMLKPVPKPTLPLARLRQSLLHPSLDHLFPLFGFRRKLLLDQGLC